MIGRVHPARVFRGWSGWRWSSPADEQSARVLIGIDPTGTAWSIGEIGPSSTYGVLVGPSGDLLCTVDGVPDDLPLLIEHEVRVRGADLPISAGYPVSTWRAERELRGWKQVELARRILSKLRARYSGLASLQVRLSVAERGGPVPDFLRAPIEAQFRQNQPLQRRDR